MDDGDCAFLFETVDKVSREGLYTNHCKACKKNFSCLLQHLRRKEECGNKFSEWDMANLKIESLLTKQSKEADWYQNHGAEQKRKKYHTGVGDGR